MSTIHIENCSKKLLQYADINMYTVFVDNGNGYEDCREEYSTYHIMQSELEIFLKKYKGKMVAYQAGLVVDYREIDYSIVTEGVVK